MPVVTKSQPQEGQNTNKNTKWSSNSYKWVVKHVSWNTSKIPTHWYTVMQKLSRYQVNISNTPVDNKSTNLSLYKTVSLLTYNSPIIA